MDHITNHTARVRARIRQQFKGKANYDAFLNLMASPAQDIEDALYDLLTLRAIDTAEGDQLDNLGTIVGQERGGLDDDTYRLYLRARIGANKSNGTYTDLIRIARLILDGEDVTVVLEPQYPASIVVNIGESPIEEDPATALIGFLRDAKAGGVRILLEYLTDTEPFKFAIFTKLSGAHSIGGTTLTVDSTEGFPDTGSLRIDAGISGVDETVTYTGRTATTFIGVSALVDNHSDDAPVTLVRSTDNGFGDDSVAGGGNFSSVKE